MKLNEKQTEVLNYMNKGWSLGTTKVGFHNRTWLQKDGLGKGGETKKVNKNTVNSLKDRNLIVSEYSFPTVKWSLTTLGRKVIKDLL